MAAPAVSPRSSFSGWSVNCVLSDPAAPSPVDEPPFDDVYGAGLSRAVVVDASAVVGKIVRVSLGDKFHAEKPVVDFFGPVDVGVVGGESREPRANVEQACVRDRVLVVVARVPLENLPSESSSTVLRVPSPGHRIEHRLRKIQPLRLVGRRVCEVPLRRLDRSNAPERLIIVSLGGGLIQRDVIPVVSCLVQQRLLDGFLKCVVLQKIPVIDHRPPGSSGLPPVVGIREHSNGSSVLVSPVVVHQTVCNQRRSCLDGAVTADVEVDRHRRPEKNKKTRKLHKRKALQKSLIA
ncbi:hypothetical protein OGATHE_000458 [Ogataea polymorpha]|uniref:Uncharacterized protein n=1 Tax=Ogataea polymorpha TaxID=460523 RepID=A0A9P8PV31_9ASCO|nr:hypothetical protein OGATHE_000458 [Ogataea polymorpha]